MEVTPPWSDAVKGGVDQTLRQALDGAATPPQQRTEEPVPRWPLKHLVRGVKETFAIDCSRETLRKLLKELGFSGKKARKLLNKANPEQRTAFLKTLEERLDDALQERCLVVYLDEAHVHLDTDEGYGWSICGQRFWVFSRFPRLSQGLL